MDKKLSDLLERLEAKLGEDDADVQMLADELGMEEGMEEEMPMEDEMPLEEELPAEGEEAPLDFDAMLAEDMEEPAEDEELPMTKKKKPYA